MSYRDESQRIWAKAQEEMRKMAYEQALAEARLKIKQEQEEMDCKQEERLAALENGKAKPIVTVQRALLGIHYTYEELKKELGDEYHIVPVFNQEAIKVCNGEEGQLLSYQPKTGQTMGKAEPKEPELKASDFPCLTIIFADDKKRIGYMDKLPYDDEDIWTKVTYWNDNNGIRYKFELTDIIKAKRLQSGIKVTETNLLQLKQGDRFAYTSYYSKTYKDVDNYYFAREIPREQNTAEKIICERAHGLEFDLHYNETPIYKFELK